MTLLFRMAIIAALVLWTTARHEGSHALAALYEGAEIQEIRLVPGIHEELGFYFGFVAHNNEATWLISSAPYIADVLLFLVASLLLLRVKRNSRWRSFIFLFGLISPLADLGYGYISSLWRTGTDVATLLTLLSPIVVHLFFIVTIAAGFYFTRWLRNR